MTETKRFSNQTDNPQLNFQEFCDCIEPEEEFNGYERFLKYSEDVKKSLHEQYLSDTMSESEAGNKWSVCTDWFYFEFSIVDPLDY